MQLALLHEAAPNQIHRAGQTLGLPKRLADLRSALRLIYGEPTTSSQTGDSAGGGQPSRQQPGVGKIKQGYREPAAADEDPGAVGGCSPTSSIPWKPRHRRFLGVNPSG
jgi:hypothetical protein